MSGAVSFTTPEPACDIRAQVAALLDDAHPKDAVFIALGNTAAFAPMLDIVLSGRVRMVGHLLGTLLTTNPEKAAAFAEPGLDDDRIAVILGYPESKSSLMRDACVVVQARDADGNVIVEAAASNARLEETVRAFEPHVPPGGKIVLTTVPLALERRKSLE